MDEARFFFPAREVSLLNHIDDLITQHEVSRATWARHNDDDSVRLREADVMGDAFAKLSAIHREMPKLFASELGFDQLTSPGTASV